MAWVDGSKPASPPDEPKKGGGCCRNMSTLWLVLFNIFFAMLGLGILAIGVLLRFNSELFNSYVTDIMMEAETEGMDLKTVFESVAIVFMILGFIVTIFAVMGIVGACCKVKMLLTVYALVMLKILILEIVMLVLLLVFRGEIDSRVKSALQVTLDTYEGYNSTAPVTLGWNYVFSKFECCGIDAYTDLGTAASWPTSVTYAGSPATLVAPIFCCKITGTFPSMTLPATASCAETPSANVSNYESGCYQAVEDYVMTYRTALIAICACIMACEIANIVTSIIVRQGLARDEKNRKQHKRKKRAWQRQNNRVGGDV